MRSAPRSAAFFVKFTISAIRAIGSWTARLGRGLNPLRDRRRPSLSRTPGEAEARASPPGPLQLSR